MIYRFYKILAVILVLFTPSYLLNAQISAGGTPLLLEHPEWFSATNPTSKPFNLKAPNKSLLEAEDAKEADPVRFAAPISTSISFDKVGVWTNVPTGGRVWHCAFYSKDALGLIFLFDKLILPKGARFFAFTPNGRQKLGAYTEVSNSPTGHFSLGVIEGETTILEIYEPATAIGATQMSLNRVDYAYNETLYKSQSNAEGFGFNTASACQVNVNCSAGNSWQQEKKGVARIKMTLATGTGWCTGTLVANQKGDRTPFLLTAYHCMDGQNPIYPLWTFDFWFESDSCNNPVYPPTPRTIMGCTQRSGWIETDFLLLELNPIPSYYDVYYNGINRSLAAEPLSTTFIHHASGDIKKISTDNDIITLMPQQIVWNNNHTSGSWTHFKVQPEVGYFQPGSSGAALFEPQKRIIGTLHGGDYDPDNPCVKGVAYFARLSLSWDNPNADDSTQTLAFWLDPEKKAGQTLEGYVPSDPTVSISGRVRSYWGANMAGVQVHLTGDKSFVGLTDAMGAYEFKGLTPGGNYSIEIKKDGADLNGVNSFDLLKIRKYMLAIEALSPWEIIAGDALNNNDLSTFDVIEIRKLSLGIISEFTMSNSWRFYETAHTFLDPENPFLNMPLQKKSFTNLQKNALYVDFTGVKVGDVDASADPNL